LLFGKLGDQDAEYRAKKEGWPETQAKKCTGQGRPDNAERKAASLKKKKRKNKLLLPSVAPAKPTIPGSE
jgi:hypothetical protein